MNYPQHIINQCLDTIFPIKCIECGRLSPSGRTYLCKKCLNSIPIKKSFECIGCENKVSLGITCFRCRKTNNIDQLLAVCDYSDPVIRKSIKTFKYRFVTEMAKPISVLAKKYIVWLSTSKDLTILEDSPIIIPIPLYRRRLNWRGFNHAEILAKTIADHLQLNCEVNILKRNGSSKPQADIKNKDERLKNLSSGMFSVINKEKIQNKTIILVDDVCTTGATMSECASVLKSHGAKKVIGFVIARG